MDRDDEIIEQFLMESRENLDLLDRELVELELDPSSQRLLSSIFRTVHTVKGTAGFLAFKKLEAVAHTGESLLSLLRDGKIRLEETRTTGLLAMVDAIRRLVNQVATQGNEGTEHLGALIEALGMLKEDSKLAAASAQLANLGHGPKILEPAAKPIAEATKPVECTITAPPPTAYSFSPAVAVSEAKAESNEQKLGAAANLTKPSPDEGRHADTRIRVDVSLLDRLMNLVGELVLARNQLLQYASKSQDEALIGTCQRLNLIAAELQEGVMKTRMQPIDNVWSKFPRIVRDLARSCGKEVALEMDGNSTELDKTIIEAISDPLTHLIRNSIDHGLEAPAERQIAKKARRGVLKLRAFHEGGRVNIDVMDDGRGIDVERIRAKAIERGLITPESARSLSSHDILCFIFAPGFSTAETVTNVSGRGVGMDVVKSNIERIGGTVDIETKLGQGTSIRIKIPLTLAIVPALVVGAGGELFAIPQVNLVELVRLDNEQAKGALEYIHGVPVFRLRGTLLTLIELSQVLNLESKKHEDVNIVVLQADERQFGLLVDSINDTEEIVVKPLNRELKSLNVYAGATIRGDGRVALILDVVGLAERAAIGVSERRAGVRTGTEDSVQTDRKSERLVLFRSGTGARMALPLDTVARLEEFSRDKIETIGDQEVVQYRGEIMPLIHLTEMFGGRRGTGDLLQVIVHASEAGSVGFVVEAIEDIVESAAGADSRSGGRRGVRGARVVQGLVTELLDADEARAMAERH